MIEERLVRHFGQGLGAGAGQRHQPGVFSGELAQYDQHISRGLAASAQLVDRGATPGVAGPFPQLDQPDQRPPRGRLLAWT